MGLYKVVSKPSDPPSRDSSLRMLRMLGIPGVGVAVSALCFETNIGASRIRIGLWGFLISIMVEQIPSYY